VSVSGRARSGGRLVRTGFLAIVISLRATAAASEPLHPLGPFGPLIKAPREQRLVVAELPAPPRFRLPIAAIPVLPLYGTDVKGLKVRGKF
jgi:hypothetical protein